MATKDSSNYSTNSWKLDDMEDPMDNDIWVERDEDHARNMSVLLCKQLKEKKCYAEK